MLELGGTHWTGKESLVGTALVTNDNDMVLILGNFNATVGRDSLDWEGILGRHGVGSCNDNGRFLLDFCTECPLAITNTIFQQKSRLKTAWTHRQSMQWHLLVYMLVRQQDLKDIFHTCVMTSVECSTDHRLVCCKLKLRF